MSNPLRAVPALVVLAVPLWTVHAQGPGRPAATGRVVVLDTDRLIEGEVERLGAQFRVRHAAGELWLPAAKVKKVCASREEAFAFVSARSNLTDPAERVRLARWCQLNGLPDQAVRQATFAIQLRPDDTEGRRLLEVLQRATASRPAPAPKVVPVPVPATTCDISLASLTAFVTRVQPILMNTCVRCHSGGRAGLFNLTPSYDGGPIHGRATQQNLAAVLAQVNLKRPALSPLLVKAVSTHGGNSQPPIRGCEAPPYQLLAEWIELTAVTNPQLSEPVDPRAAMAEPVPEAAAERATEARKARPSVQVEDQRPSSRGPVVVSNPPAGSARPAAAGLAPTQPSGPPADEFDPGLFNGLPQRR